MEKSVTVYLHIPFCQRRCPYCAFYSVDNATDDDIRAYPRRILREFVLKSQDWCGLSLSSIYIGGGTPSLLNPAEIREIITTVKSFFQCTPDLEITLETNPGTVDAASLDAFRNAGVNRLSLGIQALDNDRLMFLGRIHDRAAALRALEDACNIPDLKISTDLMVGTPLETSASWNRELDRLLRYRPDSVSFYSLTVEEETELARRYRNGEEVYLPADITVDLLTEIGAKLAQAGYRHYEVSNWALPGSECRHNIHYWRRGIYLGLGPSAHSFDGERRTWNLPDLKRYAKAVDEGRLPSSDSEILTEEEKRTEWVYLSLRQADGLNGDAYRSLFGEPPHYWRTILEKIAEAGLGKFDGIRFIPNDRGLLLADEIARRLLG